MMDSSTLGFRRSPTPVQSGVYISSAQLCLGVGYFGRDDDRASKCDEKRWSRDALTLRRTWAFWPAAVGYRLDVIPGSSSGAGSLEYFFRESE